jgi:hypothetical protein
VVECLLGEDALWTTRKSASVYAQPVCNDFRHIPVLSAAVGTHLDDGAEVDIIKYQRPYWVSFGVRQGKPLATIACRC